jgi:hypothetical protein
MTTVEIAAVDALPPLEESLGAIPTVLAFLLTRLLREPEALLHAERRRSEAEVAWYLRPRDNEGEGEDVRVASLPAGMFSSLVSRVALMADVDYARGGAGDLELTQGSRKHVCRVFLSRCRASGTWIRVYGRVVGPYEGEPEPPLPDVEMP